MGHFDHEVAFHRCASNCVIIEASDVCVSPVEEQLVLSKVRIRPVE